MIQTQEIDIDSNFIILEGCTDSWDMIDACIRNLYSLSPKLEVVGITIDLSAIGWTIAIQFGMKLTLFPLNELQELLSKIKFSPWDEQKT